MMICQFDTTVVKCISIHNGNTHGLAAFFPDISMPLSLNHHTRSVTVQSRKRGTMGNLNNIFCYAIWWLELKLKSILLYY